ncbi:class I SAM-dependent methyltransferase [Jiella sp. M17.18]|uniref:class I SAM-dependent methyltransferase n=1 Tax=Jiella sp. M17.18 TaxID=3234247 RepID=UPI0034DF4C18
MSAVETLDDHWVKPDPLSNPLSIERRFRARRFEHVRSLIEECLQQKERVEIVDLGGTEKYWLIAEDFLREQSGRVAITLVNNEPIDPPKSNIFTSLLGDACDPALFGDRRFDLVHSNSVIEHVGERERMAAFARNVRRMSDRYYVQTPNFWFPLEPHFRVVGFQWLPLPLRAMLMRQFNLGFFPRARTVEEAWNNVREIRLLDRRAVAELFPSAEIRIERVAGLAKSVMAIGRPAAG